jgi:uridine phosphorylase
MATFPNISNKHDSDSIIEPTDFLKYLKDVRKFEIPEVPENVVFIYQSSLDEYVANRKDFKEIKDNKLLSKGLGGKFYISDDKNLGVVSMFGIGSPVAVAVLEEIIVLGAKRFFNIGTAGSIQKDGKLGDIILCEKAIRDEGASYHYKKSGKYSYPSEGLTSDFRELLSKSDIEFKSGATWTIDAPYRETVDEAKQYQNEGVLTVEMEASALFTVAEYRKVEIMAAFSISDLLGEFEWTPAFHSSETGKSLETLFGAIIKLVKKL